MTIKSTIIVEGLNILAPNGGGKPTGSTNADWFDLTPYTQRIKAKDYGFTSPRAGAAKSASAAITLTNINASTGATAILMPNNIGNPTDTNTNVISPGNRIRIRAYGPSLGNCMKVYFDSSVTGVAGASDVRQTVTQAIAAAQVWTLSWQARAQWDSRYNTDTPFIVTSAETQTPQSVTYTNKWATYSITFTTTAIATTIAGVVRPTGINTTGTKQTYQYVEYKNFSLSCPAVSSGANILTNGNLTTGLLTPWSVTTATTGSYVASVVPDSWTLFNGFIDAVIPAPFGRTSLNLTVTVNCVDYLTLFTQSRVDLALQQTQRADQLLSTVLGLMNSNPVASYFNVVKTDGPLRYYRLGETSGTTFVDSGVASQNGTANATGVTLNSAGAIIATGNTDGSVTLDGSTGYISIPSVAIASDSFSIEAWIYPTAAPAAYSAIFGAHTAATTDNSFYVRLNNNLSITVGFNGDDQVGTAAKITLNTWNHVVGTYDNTTKLTTILINGVVDVSGGHGPFLGATPTCTIGYSGFDAANTHTFQGRIDEFAIYSIALSTAQALNHYNTGITFAAARQKSWLPGKLFDTGYNTFAMAFDGYTKTNATSVNAIDDTVDSEFGETWIDRDGTIRFGNWSFKVRQAAKASVLTLTSASNTEPYDMIVMADPSTIINRAVVSYRPRQTIAGTIALGKITGSVAVPPAAGSTPGTTTITIPFIDANSGRTIAGTSVIIPLVPTTDYLVNERTDATGVDYTTSPYFKIVCTTLNASEVVFQLYNYASGQLQVNKLQIRGTGIYTYNPSVISVDAPFIITSDSTASLTRYREHVYTRNPAFTTDANFINAWAKYYLSQYAEWFTEAQQLMFQNTDRTNSGVDLLSIEINDPVTLTDAQSGLSATKHLVRGIAYDLAPGGTGSIAFTLARADSTPYWVWDTSTWDGGAKWYI